MGVEGVSVVFVSAGSWVVVLEELQESKSEIIKTDKIPVAAELFMG